MNMQTSAIARQRLTDVLIEDRRTPAPVRAQTYTSSEGKRGSTLYDWFVGSEGKNAVSERAALGVAAVFACVSLIAGAIAGFPFHLFERTPKGRARYDKDKLWWLFNESPCENWTSASAWEYAVMGVLLQGDGFWRIHRTSRLSNNIAGFEPLHKLHIKVCRQDGRNKYIIRKPGEDTAVVDQDDMLHFAGLGFDGMRSLTPLQYALRNSAGIAIAADDNAGDFFRGGQRSELFLTAPGKISPEQENQLRDRWDAKNIGAQNARYPIILNGSSGGEWKIQRIGISAADAQLIETRQYQVEDICRIYGVPPHMVAKTDASTSWGSGIEAMGTGFVRFTLRAHLNRIEQEINRKIWPQNETLFGEFNVKALLQGDSKAQAEQFSKALGGPGAQGYMSVNEVRRIENLPPDEDPRSNCIQFAGAKIADTSSKDNQNA